MDVFDTIYIWIGHKSNKFERNGAAAKAEKYVAGVTDSRNKDEVCIVEVLAGHEPAQFTVQFIQWEPEIAEQWLKDDPVLIAKAAAAEKAEEEAKEAAKDIFEGFLDPKTNKFPYDDLKDKFPKGVLGKKKEYYLSEEEFEKVFSMKKVDYEKLKEWKQADMKKKHGLF
jgi:hypothetical protein